MNLDNFKLDARTGLYIPKRKTRGAIPRPVRRRVWLVRVDGEVKALAALCDPGKAPAPVLGVQWPRPCCGEFHPWVGFA